MNRLHLGYVGDGTNYHVQKWLPALVAAGMDVTLITFDTPDTELPGVDVRLLKRPFRLRRTGVGKGTGAEPSAKPRWADYLLPAGRVRSVLEEASCDILMGSYATHYGWLAARAGFNPFVLQTWTGDLTVYPFSGLKRLVFGPIVRYGIARADLVTTDGRALAERARMLYPDRESRFVPVRWGIDTNRLAGVERTKNDLRRLFNLRDIDRMTVVTSPRGLQHWYQPGVALDAIDALLHQRESVFAVILTLGHDRTPEVEARIDKLRLNPRVLIVEQFLDSRALNGVWGATDVVLSIPHADGISESVLEAVYVGAVPVLSKIPSNESLVADGLDAALVTNDAFSVAATLLEAVDRDSADLESIRQRNRRWVEENATIRRTTSQLVALLEELRRASVVEE